MDVEGRPVWIRVRCAKVCRAMENGNLLMDGKANAIKMNNRYLMKESCECKSNDQVSIIMTPSRDTVHKNGIPASDKIFMDSFTYQEDPLQMGGWTRGSRADRQPR